MGKVIANILLFGLALALSFFTGARTLDLLAQWLPTNQEIMKWLGLAAFEGGFYFWSLFFSVAATGSIQRGISLLMMGLDFVSIAVATVADLVLVGAQDGKLPSIPMEQRQAIVVFVGVVIVINVGAFIATKSTHPAKLREWAIRDAEDTIIAEELGMIRRTAPGVAAQMAPVKTQQWVADTWNQMIPGAAYPMIAPVYAHNNEVETTVEEPVRPAQQQQPPRVVQPLPKRERESGLLSGLGNLFFGKKEPQRVVLQKTGTVKVVEDKEPVPAQKTPVPEIKIEPVPAQKVESKPMPQQQETRPTPRPFIRPKSRTARRDSFRQPPRSRKAKRGN